MATTAQDKFRLAAKTALLKHGLSVASLARKIGKARNTVSRAINHDQLPTVQRLVAKNLGIEAPR